MKAEIVPLVPSAEILFEQAMREPPESDAKLVRYVFTASIHALSKMLATLDARPVARQSAQEMEESDAKVRHAARMFHEEGFLDEDQQVNPWKRAREEEVTTAESTSAKITRRGEDGSC